MVVRIGVDYQRALVITAGIISVASIPILQGAIPSAT